MAVKAPYASLSCSFIGVGCPSYIPIHGFVDDGYKEVYNLFLNNFKRGDDMGAAISAYVNGRQVLSLQGGWKDKKNEIEYTKETLQMSSIIVAQLVEQGLLAYEERIATYWPEFSQGNKENVTLEDLMRHRSGMACLDHPLSYENASNPDKLADILARQPHNFGGKAVHAYHGITQGWIQNEIIRRVDPENRTIDNFARTFKEKWGSEWYLKPDVTKGLDLKRISPFYSRSIYQQILPFLKALLDPRQDSSITLDLFRKNSFVMRAFRNPHMDQYLGVMNTNVTHRSVEGPSYSGHTNADSIAKLASILANRGKSIVPGEPDLFIKDTTFDIVSQYIDDYETDIVLPLVPFVNLKGGWMLFPNQHFFKVSDQERSAEFIGGMGAGGSLFAFNEKYQIGFGYVTNGYYGTSGIDERSIAILSVRAPFASFPCTLFGIGCISNIPIHGYVDDDYKEVYDIFLNNFKQGLDVGASVSAYVDGRKVISLQGGWQDIEEKVEYTNKSLQMVFSTTKILGVVVIAQLVEQGLLSYDEKISTYWPEFAQGNKENVTLCELMRHKSGVASLDKPLSFQDAYDPDVLAEILAKQPHNFGGKPIRAYHSFTQGWYQNEIIRRVDPQRRTIDSIVREFKDKWGSEWYLKPEATEGLDLKRIAPFYRESLIRRLVSLASILINPWRDTAFFWSIFDKTSLLYGSAIHANLDQERGLSNTNKTHRTVEAPAYSGYTNTDSMAKLGAILANRGKSMVPGEPDLFLKDSTFEELTKFISEEADVILPELVFVNLRGGLRLLRNKDNFKLPESENIDFLGGVGSGGSVLAFNEEYKLAFAYNTNSFYSHAMPDDRSSLILGSIVKQVKKKAREAELIKSS
ncbi:hypothetical protein INT48_007113 [Thamnidium elegans]|uniref:Beta-lactamase-related domain-containing protein n=1 Tax=Thamnidium elegans TaxID=101142 RepID=A0A8H7VZ44_9FUNG|nr:hypothetical protein INT48_007113 [Thamnidium elegans]